MTTIPQNVASSLVGLASQKARVSRQWSDSYLAGCNNHAAPAYTGMSKLASDQLHLPCGLLEQTRSWGEGDSPWFPAGTNRLFPAACPPYHNTQCRRWQCTSQSFTRWVIKELGGLELAALLKYHERFGIQCDFTDNCYLRPNLVHIILGI